MQAMLGELPYVRTVGLSPDMAGVGRIDDRRMPSPGEPRLPVIRGAVQTVEAGTHLNPVRAGLAGHSKSGNGRAIRGIWRLADVTRGCGTTHDSPPGGATGAGTMLRRPSQWDAALGGETLLKKAVLEQMSARAIEKAIPSLRHNPHLRNLTKKFSTPI